MTRPGLKPSTTLPWLSLAVALIALLTGMAWLLEQQQDRMLEDSERNARDDMKLIQSFVQQVLRQGDYQAIDHLLRDWGEKRGHINAIKLTSANGFVLGHYRRADGAADGYRISNQIPYSYQGLANLELVTDRTWIGRRMDRLKGQLIGASIAIGAVLWLLVWLGVRRRTEAAVLRARTRELNDANSRLRYEMAQRKQTERTLQEERDRDSQILDVAGMLIVLIGSDQNVILVNRKGCDILGYDENDIVGRNWFDQFVPETVRTEVKAVFDRLMAGELMIQDYENPVITSSGNERLIAWNNSIVYDSHGQIMATLSSGIDVTERKRIEGALRALAESTALSAGDEFYRMHTRDLAGIYGTRYAFIGVFADRTKTSIRTLGAWSGGNFTDNFTYDLAGTPCQDIVNRKMELVPDEAMRRYPEDLLLAEMEVQSYFGAPLISSSGETMGLVSVMDVKPLSPDAWTRPILRIFANRMAFELERQQAEAAVREGERALSTLMSNLPGMAYRCRNDPDWTMQFVSTGTRELTGYKPDDLIESSKLSFAEVIHSEDRKTVWQAVQAAIKDKQPYQLSYRITTATGDNKWVWEQGQGVWSQDGALQALEGLIIDITPQRRVEQALRESQEQLRLTLDNAPIGIATTDTEGRLLTVNPAFCHLIGYPADDLTRMSITDITHPDDRESTAAEYRELLQRDAPSRNFETRCVRRDGEEINVHAQFGVARDAQGKPREFVVEFENITERKRTEAALGKLHQIAAASDRSFADKIEDLLQTGCDRFRLPIGILARISGNDYHIVHALSPDNSITPGSVLDLGQTYCNETLKADHPIGFEHASESEWKTHPCYREFRLEAYLGMPVHIGCEVYGTVNFSSPTPRDVRFTSTDKEILGLMAQWIGGELARQRTDEQLRESEEQLRLTLQNAPIGIATSDLQGRLLSVNPAFCNILGYSEEELLRLSVNDITYPDDRSETAERFQSLVQGNIPSYELDKRYVRKDGTIIIGHARGALVRNGDGRPFRVVGEVEDITERRRAEEMFRLVVELAPNAIVMVNPDGQILLVNSQTEKFFGYARDELMGQPVEMLIPERWRGRHPAHRRGFLSEPRARAMGAGRELFGRRKDGGEFPIEIGLSPIETNQGTLVLSAIVDISERKRAAQEVQRMRAYLKNIVDSMPSILVGVDADGRITEWNRGAEQATGVPANRAIGNGFGKLLPAYESQLRSLREAIRNGEPVRTERMITEQDGETHFTDVVVYPLVSNGAVGGVIRVDDVTNRVRIEQMMVQTEKMMTVGGLAAGMAHEINNPLSGILQSCQNINRRISPELPANRVTAESLGQPLEGIRAYMIERGILDFVEGIRDAAERASRIVADMLTFSRRSGTELVPVALDEMLDAVVRLAGSDYDLKKKYDFRQIEIVRDYDPELEAVPCNQTEIEQVVLNLIKNAAQAMVEADSKLRRITLRTRRDDGFACVEVEDTGPGMDEDTRRRAFDPFFTTKPAGSGTGLGLSVSYFIVTEQHRGAMSVSSKPGEGTCFLVQLPLQKETSA